MVQITLVRAGGYVRMSGRGQEKSPAEQRHEITKLAEREGCHVVSWFTDEAISGDSGTDDRPGLAALLDAAEAGKFKVVLAWHTNRLSREDPMSALVLYNRLRKADVGLITCCEGRTDLNDFAKQLLLFVNQKGSNDFLVELSAKTLRGKIANAKLGGFNGGPVHYGMDRGLFDAAGNLVRRLGPGEVVRMAGCNVRLIPGADQVKIEAIRYAFERFDRADLTLRGLGEELDRKGYESPRGIGWTSANVNRLLRTRAYVGTSRWGAVATGEYHTAQADQIVPRNGNGHNGRKGRPWRRKPAEDALVVTGAHEGIVGLDLFLRVQMKLDGRQAPRATARRKKEFPLSGLMVCDHCGEPMIGETGHGPNGDKTYTYHRYVCRRSAKFGVNSPQNTTCGHHAVRADRVQAWLVHKLQETFLGPGRDVLVQEIKKQIKAEAKAPSDVGRLQKRAADLDREVGRLVKAIRTVDAEELTEELAIVRSERDRIKAELDQASKLTTAGSLDEEAERIADGLWELGERLTDADPALVREAFRQFVSLITCRWKVKLQGKRRRYELVRGEVHLRPQARPDPPDSLMGVQDCTSPRTCPGRRNC